MFRIRKVNKKNIAEEIKSGDIVQHFKRTDDMQANEYLYRIIAAASAIPAAIFSNIHLFLIFFLRLFRRPPFPFFCSYFFVVRSCLQYAKSS